MRATLIQHIATTKPNGVRPINNTYGVQSQYVGNAYFRNYTVRRHYDTKYCNIRSGIDDTACNNKTIKAYIMGRWN